MEVNSKFLSIDINEKLKKFTWRIENFSSIKDCILYSEIFTVDGYKWRISIYPTGCYVDHLSIFLELADSATTLPNGWISYAQFGFAVINQIDRKTSVTQATAHEFKDNWVCWGFRSFLPLSELHNPECGYLVNDACLVEAYFSFDRTKALISHELIVETGSGKHKTEEADCIKSVRTNHETTISEPVDIGIASPTQPSCQIVPTGHEPSKEDMNTFFMSLEFELSSSYIVYSREEAKEALVKLEEALSMTPVNFQDAGKFSPLKHAFKILASFDCSSTALTIEEKDKLLAMEERLKELVDRAAKAVQDKNQLILKESIKLTLTRNLDRNLIRYKEMETEVKQVEQKLAALHEQVTEAQKKRENMLGEQKGIFRISKKMKTELGVLKKEWGEYEANAKVAKAEEKTVEAEWGRVKDFISSIKRKI